MVAAVRQLDEDLAQLPAPVVCVNVPAERSADLMNYPLGHDTVPSVNIQFLHNSVSKFGFQLHMLLMMMVIKNES